jgi:hypothetical protein
MRGADLHSCTICTLLDASTNWWWIGVANNTTGSSTKVCSPAASAHLQAVAQVLSCRRVLHQSQAAAPAAAAARAACLRPCCWRVGHLRPSLSCRWDSWCGSPTTCSPEKHQHKPVRQVVQMQRFVSWHYLQHGTHTSQHEQETEVHPADGTVGMALQPPAGQTGPAQASAKHL